MKIYGYVRVSSTDQNEERQMVALREVSVPEKAVPDDFGKIVKAWEQKKLPLADVLRQCNMSEATFNRRLWEYRLLRDSKKAG